MTAINNLTRSRVDKTFLKRVAQIVLKSESKKGNLSIALVGLKRIQNLNRKYRKRNQPTDVLSFSQPNNFLIIPGTEGELGEIVICPQMVRKNARKLNLPFKKELARVLIHGILHLLGYRHEKGKKGFRKMEKKQEHYLSQIYL